MTLYEEIGMGTGMAPKAISEFVKKHPKAENQFGLWYVSDRMNRGCSLMCAIAGEQNDSNPYFMALANGEEWIA